MKKPAGECEVAGFYLAKVVAWPSRIDLNLGGIQTLRQATAFI